MKEEPQPSSGSKGPVKDQIEEDGDGTKHEILEDEPEVPKRRKRCCASVQHISNF